MAETSLKPIQRQSVAEAVFDQLRDTILGGEIAAGETLPGERRLSEILGVNRGAVREALKKLEQVRLVSIQQGDGTRVLDFRDEAHLDLLAQLIVTRDGKPNLEAVRSVIELRAVILPEIARLAALRREAGELPALAQAIERLETAGDPDTFLLAVETFWKILSRMSRNLAYRLITNTMRELHARYVEVLRPMLGDAYYATGAFVDIAQAVERGEADAAREAARKHAEQVSALLGGCRL